MQLMHHVASLVRKAPWVVTLGRAIWRLGQAKFSAGVVGVVFDERGRVLLVEHVFHPYAPWGLPGGWVDRHENPAYTVQRELREELDLAVDIGPILKVEIDYGNHLDFAFLCYAAGPVGKLSRELLSYDWYDLNNLPRLQNFHYQAIVSAVERTKCVLQ
jgi:8-oxo-dGTP diphosphatase